MKRKIVLVDDEQNVLESIRRILHRDDYDVHLCTSAAEAMSHIVYEQGRVDIVISDNKMPKTQGVDLLVALRQKYPNVIRIMLTGQSDLEDAKKAINEGAVYRFLTKPCDPDELRLVVRHAIAHKDLWEQNKKLLEKLECQQHTIEELERKHPGITHVTRNDTGSIELQVRSDETLDDFLKRYMQ